MATARAAAITRGKGMPGLLINWAATAPAMAMTAPTDKSTPPVAQHDLGTVIENINQHAVKAAFADFDMKETSGEKQIEQ